MTEYAHAKLNEENRSIAGGYIPCKESIIKHKGREVLYVIGQANLDTSCCATGDWCYVMVPGYIVRWHIKTSDSGLPVSEVEPVINEKEREEIRKAIRESDLQAEGAREITFW
jgi:hypothetical protein